jgi:hypothetical protein
MKRKPIKVAKQHVDSQEPSAASLREIPEIDFSKHKRLERGRYAERARQSLEIFALDKQLVATLGGPDAVREILESLVSGLQKAKKRKAA